MKANTLTQRYETPEALRHDARTLSADVRALIEATSEIADEKVGAARKRLETAIERGKVGYAQIQEKAVQGARVADEAIREHPYQSAAFAFAVGALVGVLLFRRH